MVAAIIAILAAMLLPALKNAREKAKQVVCISNLKQIGVAIATYASDYNGKAPPATYQAGYDIGGDWATAIIDESAADITPPMKINLGMLCWDYIPRGDGAKVLFCASLARIFNSQMSPYPDYNDHDFIDVLENKPHGMCAWTGYVYRSPKGTGPSYKFTQQTIDVSKDGNKCIVADLHANGQGYGQFHEGKSMWQSDVSHQGSLNLLFMDGHVISKYIIITDGFENDIEKTFAQYFDPLY